MYKSRKNLPYYYMIVNEAFTDEVNAFLGGYCNDEEVDPHTRCNIGCADCGSSLCCVFNADRAGV